MMRIVVALTAVVMLAVAMGAASLSGPADAQDRSEERLTALETQIADQATEVTGLRGRVKRLEGAVLTPRAESSPTPGAETEVEPSPTPTEEQAAAAAVTPGGEVGSRDTPIPFGTSAEIGNGWLLTVTDINPNAADVILATNQFNDPPADGQQFVMAMLSATYNGSQESTNFLVDVTVQAVGQSGVAYNTYDPGCGVIPDELPVLTDVFQGGTLAGNICWSVEASDVDSLVMYTETDFGDTRVFFALRPA